MNISGEGAPSKILNQTYKIAIFIGNSWKSAISESPNLIT